MNNIMASEMKRDGASTKDAGPSDVVTQRTFDNSMLNGLGIDAS